ncbi:MAG: DMT family transporter [Ruminococcus sp.]|nr:DMT family transporter [Ruminococcus sp.]
MKNGKMTAILYAIAAALFYALNVPCSKLLLHHTPPTMMAGLLYVGAGLGVGVMYLFHLPKEQKTERLDRSDLPYVIGMVLLDIIAPILLMVGVQIGSSANATLLGNFEIVATTVIALIIFKEKVSGFLWTAIAFITLSSILLTFGGADSFDFSVGSLFVLGATVCWGFENNCTRKISGKSTYQIVTIKGLCSGAGSLIIALAIGERITEWVYVLPALLLGFVAYGLSIFTYIRAQKTLGAAKTSAYYAVAPFIGAFLSFALLREDLSVSYILALAVMLAGTAFVVYDTLLNRHTHAHNHTFTHTHDGTTHTHTVTHSHRHDHFTKTDKHTHHHSQAELEKLLVKHSS